MANRVRQLQPAVDVARERETQAAREMAEFKRRVADQEGRLNQLRAFRSEYGGQLQNAGRAGMTACRLGDYLTFMANLDRSIARAQQQLEALRGEGQRRQERWTATRAKTQALTTVIERYRSEQNQIDARREQAESDALGLRKQAPG
ncbi:MAG: flagellar export protein FliJ [Gammaproteobacteria bacterium]